MDTYTCHQCGGTFPADKRLSYECGKSAKEEAEDRRSAAACSARLSFIRVTTPGCEGTINLMWDDYPVAWVNNVQIAREMMREIPEQNAPVLATADTKSPTP